MDRWVIVIILMVGPMGETVLAETPKPKIELVCPQMVRAGFSIELWVRIKNVNERFWCPELEWCIGTGIDETCSSHESDCAPFDETGEEDRASWSSNHRRLSLPPGDTDVIVKMKKAKRVIWRKKCTIHAR